MKGYAELLRKLKNVKERGYVKTHRSGNTGIGKTLEDLLGIKENNIPGPNGLMIELKSARKSAKSMLTLLTKSPEPEKANSILFQRYGYPSSRGNDKKELHTTVNAIDFNTIKGKSGFKIVVNKDRIALVSESHEVLGYWNKETLRQRFQAKLSKLLYVKAESRGLGRNEEFWFDEGWLLNGFDFTNFMELIREGNILVDIRIGQYPNGRPHDHGTAFRVHTDKLELCFSNRDRVL